ncbi:DUF2867 domain-containing protein [Kiloniella sp.]|uniref:DUF2867 domain-containing protein n=1 Tax=Kiloniella sp. TaxID=1938587 RepID=UPI003B01C4C2
MTKPEYFTYGDTNIQLLAPVDELDFFDTQSVCLSKEISSIEAWRVLVSNPSPVLKLAFRIRDMVSSWFGVKRIGGFGSAWPKDVQVNDRLDFFLVEYLTSRVLTLSVRDKHLDVMLCITTDQNVLTITSSVKVHNAFGRIYMIPVAPTHRLIVRNDLKRLKQEIL